MSRLVALPGALLAMLHGVFTLRSLRIAVVGVCLWSLSPALGSGVEAQVPGADLPPPPRTAMVIDAATRGIDPRVGQHVTLVMRETMAAMGYAVATGADTLAAAQGARMPYPPAPADLWRVTVSAGVDRTVFARVWADSGRYVYELTVASADGTGPFFARGSSGAEDLYAVVEGLTREAVPPPSSWDAAAAARYLSLIHI